MCSTLGLMNPAPRSALAASSAALLLLARLPSFTPGPTIHAPGLSAGPSRARVASPRRARAPHPPAPARGETRTRPRARAATRLPPRHLRDGLCGPFAVFAASWAGHDDPRRPRDVHTIARALIPSRVRRPSPRARGLARRRRRRSKSFGDFAHARLHRARRARTLADVGGPGGDGGARAPIPRIPICHRKKRPEVPALCGVVVVAIRDPPRRAQGMRERRRAQAHPTVERARQSVLQTPGKRRQTHHDIADVFVPVAASASVVAAAGESERLGPRPSRERRDVRLPARLARSCRSNGQSIPTDRATCARPRDVRNARVRDGSPPTITAGTLVDSPRDSSTGARRRDFIDGFVVEFEVVAAGVSITVASLGSSRESSRVPSAFLSLSPFLLARARLPARAPRAPPTRPDGFHRRKVPRAMSTVPWTRGGTRRRDATA